MYTKIMVPVDLTHLDALDRALTTAADLATHYKIPVVYVGVTAETPTPVAHNPGEFAQKMDAFAKAQAAKHGIAAEGLGYASHDPAIEIEQDEVEIREIVPGPVKNNDQVVEEGLAGGERVIVEGLQKVRPGMKVAPKLVREATPAPPIQET